MTSVLTERSQGPMTTPEAPAPIAAILQLLFGKHITYALSAVARLGVADHIGQDPVGIETLAHEVSAQPAALYRVMRMLASVGVFKEMPGQRFGPTPLSEVLKTDAPGSVRYFAMQFGDPWSTRPFEHFTDTVRSGADGVNLAFGKNIFDLFAEEPEQAETFHRSMTGLSAAMTAPLVDAYDFSGIKRLADIGGGHGMLLSGVLNRYRNLKGVVYDLPEVVAGAIGQPHLANCAERVEFEGGSFFERVPADCDAYMLKFILHDWNDECCVKILRCIREQLPANGRVLVCEQVIETGAEPSLAKFLDIEMLALTVGGKERTAAEFAALFAAAGLQLTKIVPTQSPLCVIEARLV